MHRDADFASAATNAPSRESQQPLSARVEQLARKPPPKFVRRIRRTGRAALNAFRTVRRQYARVHLQLAIIVYPRPRAERNLAPALQLLEQRTFRTHRRTRFR